MARKGKSNDEKAIITDDRHENKYFWIAPQLVHFLCRHPYDLALWDTVRLVAGEGECILDTPELADLGMMSVGKVVDSREYLIYVGLLGGEKRRDEKYRNKVWHLWIPDLMPANIEWRLKFRNLKERIELKRLHRWLLEQAGVYRQFDKAKFEALDLLVPFTVKRVHIVNRSYYELIRGKKGSHTETKKNLRIGEPDKKNAPDYVDMVAQAAKRGLTPERSVPTTFEQNFPDKKAAALATYYKHTQFWLQPAQKRELEEFEQSPDFDLEVWDRAVYSASVHGAKVGDIAMIITVARDYGGEYVQYITDRYRSRKRKRAAVTDRGDTKRGDPKSESASRGEHVTEADVVAILAEEYPDGVPPSILQAIIAGDAAEDS